MIRMMRRTQVVSYSNVEEVDPSVGSTYVEISGKLRRVHIDGRTKGMYFMYGDMRVWYDPQRDGALVSEVEGVDKYPEYFI